MAVDREKILQTAQKYTSKKKYDRAIAEYQKIVQQDPNDARTLLKIGDLQSRMAAYAEAIATYDRVGQFYAAQGFSLKAIAVYKQIRELIIKHVPQLSDRYGHIMPKLAEIYTELGLTSDALAAYDEVATRLQKNARDRDAIHIFRKMVELDQTNPLPHLRLAEACCRVQAVDEAIDSFWTAAELLIRLERRDDALKVVERILHFRQIPRYAKVAASLYLERAGPQDGLQALSKLQLCFQHDPKDIETLDLLARAFIAINQAPKAIEVKKEMAHIARDSGKADLYREIVGWLLEVAPHDEHVQKLSQAPSMLRENSSVSVEDVDLLESSLRPEPLGVPRRAPNVGTQDADDETEEFDVEPMSRKAPYIVSDVDIEVVDDADIDEVRPGRAFMPSAPDVTVNEADALDFDEAEEIDGDAHVRKAMVDAESFRGLRLYNKAVETLRLALEIVPRALELREKLRDVLNESGDRDAAIGEMITLAAIHLDAGDSHRAETELYAVLELEPNHATACEMLDQLGGFSPETMPGDVESYDDAGLDTEDMSAPNGQAHASYYPPEAPLSSYDLEAVPADAALASSPSLSGESEALGVDDPFGTIADESPLPSFALGAESLDDSNVSRPDVLESFNPSLGTADVVAEAVHANASAEAVEEALDEADFFASRGLYEDARTILTDQLSRTPNHPLLLEKLQEVEVAIGNNAESGTRERPEEPQLSGVPESLQDDDGVFDIAASLDALDELEQATRSSRPPSSIKPVEEVDVDQVFAKFKEGIRAQVADTDSSTHYDLGVAYKEMGLLPDAINEFEIASRDPKIQCTCQAMIGMIFLEQGDLERAGDAYVRGLSATQKTIDQEMSLYYDLGNVHEMKGSISEALYYFKKIARRDPGYRDVKDRIEALEPPRPAAASAKGRSLEVDDEFDAAFDELFESK